MLHYHLQKKKLEKEKHIYNKPKSVFVPIKMDVTPKEETKKNIKLEDDNHYIKFDGIDINLKYTNFLNFIYQSKIKNEKYNLISCFVKKQDNNMFTFESKNKILCNIDNILKLLKFFDANIVGEECDDGKEYIFIKFYMCYLDFIIKFIDDYKSESTIELKNILNNRLIIRKKQCDKIIKNYTTSDNGHKYINTEL